MSIVIVMWAALQEAALLCILLSFLCVHACII